MVKQKILIIDNVFAPSFKDKIVNGVQKFTKAQRDVLSDDFEVHYVTAHGSDLQFDNQHILINKQNVNYDIKKKLKITKDTKTEIDNLILSIEPDYVLDNSCKQFTTLYPSYNVGIVFEHYYRPSRPLNPSCKEPFDTNGVYWCGVSNWQKNRFMNLFDGITSVHIINSKPEIVDHENYGIFISRWDSGKYPHIILNLFAKCAKDFKLHVFTSINYGLLEDRDKDIIAEIRKNPNIIFHIDATREETLKYLQKATFVLGAGRESTGIVSLEGASYGVPYITRGSDVVPEQEHMAEFAMTLVKTSEGSVEDQFSAAIEKYKKYTIDDRVKIANDAYLRYNRDMFKHRQLNLLQEAKNKKYGIR